MPASSPPRRSVRSGVVAAATHQAKATRRAATASASGPQQRYRPRPLVCGKSVSQVAVTPTRAERRRALPAPRSRVVVSSHPDSCLLRSPGQDWAAMSLLRSTWPRPSRKAGHPSQPRRPMGWLVGRRSLVSSSSAMRASSWRARPSARETRSATSQVGLDVPRSRPRIEVASRSAASARASWVSPISSRRRRIARPRAICGVWLMRTPEPSVGRPRHARDHVPGSLWRRMRDGRRQQKRELLVALCPRRRPNDLCGGPRPI